MRISDWSSDVGSADRDLALVPSWGSLASSGKLNPASAEVYGRFLAERYGDKPNIVWLNGGDTLGNENTETWQVLGRTIKAADPRHLMTFHPFGRSEEHTSELQSIMRTSSAVFCLKQKNTIPHLITSSSLSIHTLYL